MAARAAPRGESRPRCRDSPEPQDPELDRIGGPAAWGRYCPPRSLLFLPAAGNPGVTRRRALVLGGDKDREPCGFEAGGIAPGPQVTRPRTHTIGDLQAPQIMLPQPGQTRQPGRPPHRARPLSPARTSPSRMSRRTRRSRSAHRPPAGPATGHDPARTATIDCCRFEREPAATPAKTLSVATPAALTDAAAMIRAILRDAQHTTG
jgi:hypothetical protein